MKKQFFSIPLLVVLTGLFLTALVSCKKDNKDEDLPQVKKYRMKTITQSEDGDVYRTVIQYNSNNKIESFTEYDGELAIYKANWTWNGNVVTLSELYFEEGQWVESSYYEQYTYTGNRMTEARAYDEEYGLTYLTTYTWDGDRVITENREIQVTDTLTANMVTTYIYAGALLTNVEHRMYNVLFRKQVIEYTEGRPVAIKTYNMENILEESVSILYSGNLISKINYLNVTQGSAGDVSCSEERTYDGSNNVATINMQCTGESPFITNLAWEEGTGNLNDILLANTGWLNVYLFPDTFPSELTMKKKKKSALVSK